MKLIMTAIALAIAAPAAAQTAPDQHAGHGMDHGAKPHEGKGCCDKDAEGKRKPCCDEAKKMDCCDKAKEGEASKHEAHAH